jgi:PAS domain-containing protein
MTYGRNVPDNGADTRGVLLAEDPLADLAAELAARLGAAAGTSAVAVYAVEPDGSLHMVGSAGLIEPVVTAWRRVSARLTTGALFAARTGEPLWLPDLDAARRRFVLIGDPDVEWPSRALLPVADDGRPAAVVAAFWDEEQKFDPAARQAVTAVMVELAPRIAEQLRRPHRAAWIADAQALLDGLPGDLAVLLPIRDDAGEVSDYVVVAAGPEAVDLAGRHGREMVGASAVADYPGIVGTDLWRTYALVLRTGRPREVGPFSYAGTAEGVDAEAVYTVRVSRLGGGLLVSWVRHDEQRRFAARLADTERLGKLGWGEWDMVTGRIDWSDGLFAIFERSAADGPAPLDEALGYLHPQDAAAVTPVLTRFFETGDPVDVTFRIVLPSGRVKHVQCRLETSRDRGGQVLKAYGLVVDVTASAVAARVADVEAELAERRQRQRIEHRLVTALQRIILPLPAGVLEPPGLRVAVRYQPAEETSQVGGDWYDVVRLPGGRTLLTVGDVAGHGITAAATMARLRHSIAALAVTSTDPAELLGYLNVLVHDDASEPTATVVVVRFDPETSTATWAQAGHPPPIVVAGGGAAALARPAGMIVGARRDSAYENATVRLAPGDTMLLYTDGLIERRDADDDDWLGPLLRLLYDAGDLPVDRLVARLQPANPADDTCALALRAA